MQVFTPIMIKNENNILDIAKSLDNVRLAKQIIEGEQILNMHEYQPFTKHPIVLMYNYSENNRVFLAHYINILQKEKLERTGKEINSKTGTYKRLLSKTYKVPEFITLKYIMRHSTNLFIKSPNHYSQYGYELSEVERTFFLKSENTLDKKTYKMVYSSAKDKYPYFYYDYEKSSLFYLSQYNSNKKARQRFYLGENK